MNCQDFWNHLPIKGLDLPHDQSAHAAECQGCAARWQRYRELAVGLESLREEWRREEAPERVESGLTAAFRVQAGYRRTRRPAAASWWGPVLAWTGAAAATIALAVVLVRGGSQPGNYRPEMGHPQNIANPQRGAQPEFAESQTGTDGEDASAVLGDGFVHLPNAPGIQPNEALNVVRFEVPASTMVALGLEINEDPASQTVLADVALGPDGTARAVRVVPAGGSLEE